MTGTRSALVLTVLLGAHGLVGAFAVAAAEKAPGKPAVETGDQGADASLRQRADASLRQRAEELARAASERFSEIIRQPKLAQSAAPQSHAAPPTLEAATDEAFAPVWGWLARSAKDYDDVIIAKFRNPSGEVVLLAPRGTVVAQQDVPPQVPETKPSETPASPPQPAWSWDGIMESARDWLNRANRSYRNDIVKKLKQPEAGAAWPPAEVVPQAPSPADVAAEAEAEQHANEVKRAAANAEADRQLELEGQKLAEEVKRKADAEAKRLAEEAEAKKAAEKQAAEAEAKRVAGEAEAKRKADAEAKRVADEAEAKRKSDAEAKRLAEETEAKHKADSEAKRLADEAEAKRKADAEAKRLAEETEAKHKADSEAKRMADEVEAKRKTDAEAKRLADEAEAKRLADEAQAKRKAAQDETARRLNEEAVTEHKAVAEAEANRLAGEAAAKRAAAEGRKPAHENSSVAIALPSAHKAPAEEPRAVEPERKARREVLAMAPVPAKVIKKKRHVAVAYEARPKKGKYKQHVAQHKRGHKHRYVVVEARHPKRVVHAYRQKSHAAPPLPVRNTMRKAPACACPRAYRTPAPHHRHKYAVRHHYAGPRVIWRSCGDDSYFDPVPWTHSRKLRHRHLIFHRPRLYISPERR